MVKSLLIGFLSLLSFSAVAGNGVQRQVVQFGEMNLSAQFKTQVNAEVARLCPQIFNRSAAGPAASLSMVSVTTGSATENFDQMMEVTILVPGPDSEGSESLILILKKRTVGDAFELVSTRLPRTCY